MKLKLKNYESGGLNYKCFRDVPTKEQINKALEKDPHLLDNIDFDYGVHENPDVKLFEGIPIKNIRLCQPSNELLNYVNKDTVESVFLHDCSINDKIGFLKDWSNLKKVVVVTTFSV